MVERRRMGGAIGFLPSAGCLIMRPAASSTRIRSSSRCSRSCWRCSSVIPSSDGSESLSLSSHPSLLSSLLDSSCSISRPAWKGGVSLSISRVAVVGVVERARGIKPEWSVHQIQGVKRTIGQIVHDQMIHFARRKSGTPRGAVPPRAGG